MPGSPLTPQQVLLLLPQTPERIDTLTTGLSVSKLHTAPDDSGWSPNDVLAHLRPCADVWGGCILRIIAEDRPKLRAVSPRTWIKRTMYPELEFGPSLRSFAEQRAQLTLGACGVAARSLDTCGEGDWSGQGLERTVLSYAEGLATHESLHVRQIERAIKGEQL